MVKPVCAASISLRSLSAAAHRVASKSTTAAEPFELLPFAIVAYSRLHAHFWVWFSELVQVAHLNKWKVPERRDNDKRFPGEVWSCSFPHCRILNLPGLLSSGSPSPRFSADFSEKRAKTARNPVCGWLQGRPDAPIARERPSAENL